MDMSGHPNTPPRAVDRDTVFLMARVRGGRGEREGRYVVRNLSKTGACIAEPGPLEKGQRLVVALGQLENVAAEVAWARDGFAGLRFLQPIDVALARRHGVKPARRTSDVKAGWLSDQRRPHQKVWG